MHPYPLHTSRPPAIVYSGRILNEGVPLLRWPYFLSGGWFITVTVMCQLHTHVSFKMYLPYGGEGYDDEVESVMEGHVAVARPPIGVLNLHQKVGKPRHGENNHHGFEPPADELRTQKDNLPVGSGVRGGTWWLNVSRTFPRVLQGGGLDLLTEQNG